MYNCTIQAGGSATAVYEVKARQRGRMKLRAGLRSELAAACATMATASQPPCKYG